MPQRLWLTTAATSLGFVLVQLDVSIVNIALARIGTSLGVGMAGLEWVVDAYTLAFASLMLSAGSLGDRLGARRGFILGFGLFIAASLACGVAPNPLVLIAARAVQGMGAAGLVPSSLALLNHACRGDAQARARAVGLWTAAGSVALAAGPVLGGLVIDGFGWRGIFILNVPIGLLGIWMTLRWVEETNPGKGALDPAGQVFAMISLSAITGAVIEAGASGWNSPVVIVLTLVAIVTGAAFLRTEARVAQPMLPLGFFRMSRFSTATLVGFAVNFTLYGAIFAFNLFLQRLAGYSPTASSLAFLPFPVALFAANLCAGPLVARFGPRVPMAAGLAVAALGFALLSTADATTPWLAMLPGLIVLPAGIGTAVPAMTTALLSCVPRAQAGIASGVLNTVRQSGGAIGVALFGNFLAHQGVSGMHRAFLFALVLLGATAVLALCRIGASQARVTDAAVRRRIMSDSTSARPPRTASIRRPVPVEGSAHRPARERNCPPTGKLRP
jgi:DHA2 family methylenomycin A resistance protein-like MFS transporter